jgi:Bacterial SH3 domain
VIRGNKRDPKAGRSSRPRVTSETSPESLGKVGWIAALGFAIGVAWPRLLGVSLVPEAPVRETLPKEEESREVAPSEPGEQKKLTPADLLEISEPLVTSCRDAEDKTLSTCNDVNFDDLFHAPLLSLTTCPGATGVFGTLSLGFEVSFREQKVQKIDSGKSTNLPLAIKDQLLGCAREQLGAVQLGKTRASAATYTVFYKLLFKSAEVAASEAETTVQASGIATVEWRTALVRDEPNGEAKVVARVLAGARLTVTGRRGDWYRVKYDAKGREGWTHGAALGLVDEK